MAKSRLGRGIDAIIPDIINDDNVQVIEVGVDELFPSPIQPRKQFNEEKIKELSESIKVNGIISPIVVRKIDTKYEIIAGERRFRASKMAGLANVPVIVKEMSDDDAFKISLIENLQREDLNPMEEAEAYYTLSQQFHLTHQEIAQSISKDRSTVSNVLRIVGLPEEIKESIRNGKLSMGHARALLMLENINDQVALMNKIIIAGLSVRETERLASAGKKGGKKSIIHKNDPYAEKASLHLSERLSTKVACSLGKKKGKIIIEVSSRDEMERIINELAGFEQPL